MRVTSEARNRGVNRLRWLKTAVVSDVENAHEMRQVGIGKTVRSPRFRGSLVTCSKSIRWRQGAGSSVVFLRSTGSVFSGRSWVDRCVGEHALDRAGAGAKWGVNPYLSRVN